MNPKARFLVSVSLALGFGLLVGYKIGEFDGRGRYYGALRAELSPFLRKISEVSEEKKKEAIQDFFLGADEIKTTPAEYLTSLGHAHDLLKKEPNQPPEPMPLKRHGSP